MLVQYIVAKIVLQHAIAQFMELLIRTLLLNVSSMLISQADQDIWLQLEKT